MISKLEMCFEGGGADPLLPPSLPSALHPPDDGDQTGDQTEHGHQQDYQLLL